MISKLKQSNIVKYIYIQLIHITKYVQDTSHKITLPQVLCILSCEQAGSSEEKPSLPKFLFAPQDPRHIQQLLQAIHLQLPPSQKDNILLNCWKLPASLISAGKLFQRTGAAYLNELLPNLDVRT